MKKCVYFYDSQNIWRRNKFWINNSKYKSESKIFKLVLR